MKTPAPPAADATIYPATHTKPSATPAVLGRFPDLLAAGFITEVSPGVYGPGNYDRNKFSVLMIENWNEIEIKRFVARARARGPVLLVSQRAGGHHARQHPINAANLWNAGGLAYERRSRTTSARRYCGRARIAADQTPPGRLAKMAA